MFTTDEIIDLIRTGYIPPDPGRLGEFGGIVDAVNDLRAQLAAAQQRIAKLDSDIDRRIEDHRRLLASIAELGKASEARGQEVERLRKALQRAQLPHSRGCAIAAMCPCSCGAGELLATPAATPAPACGCIPCRCDHETQCQGCGAKMCDRHRAERQHDKDAAERADRAKQWKSEQIAVESEWDAQKVGEVLSLPLGSSVRAGVLPAILALKARITELEQSSEARGQALKAALQWVDAVPRSTPLPTMPGFDRDWADSTLATPAATPAPTCRACNGSRLAQSIQGIPDAPCPLAATPAVEQTQQETRAEMLERLADEQSEAEMPGGFN